jgi:hypothetical protein
MRFLIFSFKNLFHLLFSTIALFSVGLNALQAQRWSGTFEWENILSGSLYKNASNTQNLKPLLRYTAFPNLFSHVNYTINPTMGLSLGFGVRNLGMIVANDSLRLKYRNFAFSFPLTYKIGRMEKPQFAFLTGMAVNLMLFYKEVHTLNKQRIAKEFGFFSEKVSPVNISFHAGFQLWILSIRGNLSLFNYLSRPYTDPITGLRPYKDITSPLWWLSVSVNSTRIWKKEGKGK